MAGRLVSAAPGFPPWAQVGAVRRAHVERVAVLLRRWAEVQGVSGSERDRWLRAVYLHDALRDAPPAELERLAPDAWGVPKLRHGPAAARLAAEHGETDRGVLRAVHYHSVGFAGWDRVGRLLYLADYLEPGRPFRVEERTAQAARVPQEPEAVLREVTAERLRWTLDAGRPLLPESVEFWNGLVGSS
jgi:HD superfamily phosphohydrolase YqeK